MIPYAIDEKNASKIQNPYHTLFLAIILLLVGVLP
jgi:hypothetical protein